MFLPQNCGNTNLRSLPNMMATDKPVSQLSSVEMNGLCVMQLSFQEKSLFVKAFFYDIVWWRLRAFLVGYHIVGIAKYGCTKTWHADFFFTKILASLE